MNVQDIRLFFQYNDWANQHILAAAKQVTPEQFVAPTSNSWGSLRGTLVHTLDTEWGWRLLCQARAEQDVILKDADFPTAESLAQRWAEEAQAMRDYLAMLTDADMLNTFHYTTNEGEERERVLWHVLFHVVNHGMQHRSEAAVLLTDYGHSPGELDFTLFLLDRPKS